MITEQAKQLSVTQEQLLSFVHALLGTDCGREDDDHPLPPGPWDPVVRAALETVFVFGPRPEPWEKSDAIFGLKPEPWKLAFHALAKRYLAIFDVFEDGDNFGSDRALNPQPLPPRFIFMKSLAQTVVYRAQLLQELSDATRREGEERSIIIVSGYLARFAADYCGSEGKLRYPFAGPRPHWFSSEINAVDRLILAAQFEQASRETFHPELRNDLGDASTKLTEAALATLG